jgi:hypothetical protein
VSHFEQRGEIILIGYSNETTEDLLDLLVSLGGIEIGLYEFEMEQYRKKIQTIKEIIISRTTSHFEEGVE